eukprot:4324492-Amphidinium_carterae.1
MLRLAAAFIAESDNQKSQIFKPHIFHWHLANHATVKFKPCGPLFGVGTLRGSVLTIADMVHCCKTLKVQRRVRSRLEMLTSAIAD